VRARSRRDLSIFDLVPAEKATIVGGGDALDNTPDMLIATRSIVFVRRQPPALDD